MASSSVAISPDSLKLDWRKMNKQELRDALASRGLDTSGLRPLLIQRLESSLKPPASVSPSPSSPPPPSVDASKLQASLVKPGAGKDEPPLASSSSSPAPSKNKDAVGKAQFSGEDLTLSAEDEERSGKVLSCLGQESKKDTKSTASNGVDAVMSGKASPLGQSKDAATDKKSELNAAAGSNTLRLSDLDKKRKRAERFGVGLKVSEEEKLALRAERFAGAQGKKKASNLDSENEKRKQRAARFGIVDESMKKAHEDLGIDVKQTEPEDAKRKARAERFGTNKLDSSKAKAS